MVREKVDGWRANEQDVRTWKSIQRQATVQMKHREGELKKEAEAKLKEAGGAQ